MNLCLSRHEATNNHPPTFLGAKLRNVFQFCKRLRTFFVTNMFFSIALAVVSFSENYTRPAIDWLKKTGCSLIFFANIQFFAVPLQKKFASTGCTSA